MEAGQIDASWSLLMKVMVVSGVTVIVEGWAPCKLMCTVGVGSGGSKEEGGGVCGEFARGKLVGCAV